MNVGSSWLHGVPTRPRAVRVLVDVSPYANP